MNRICIALLSLASIVGLGGCYYDNEEDLYPSVNDTAEVTYSGVIQPLIASKCAVSGCHIANNQAPDLSNYAFLAANSARVRIRAVEERSMPAAGPLSDNQIAKLAEWIDAGAPDN